MDRRPFRGARCSFLHGDGSKPHILREVGPEQTDLLFCLTDDDQDNIIASLVGRSLGFFDRLIASRPDLVFNVAEGSTGAMREAIYPAIYRHLGLPFTGGGTSLLLIDLDKRLAEKVLAVRGIKVPGGAFLTAGDRELPDSLRYPLMIKPNYEGSGKGIHQDSVVRTAEEARERIDTLLEKFPEGLDVEEFIAGRELTVPMLEAWPGHLLEIVEHAFGGESGYNIFDYERKRSPSGGDAIEVVCPPDLTSRERQDVLSTADRVFHVMPCPDLGRVDFRLHEDGTPYFIEINPLPRLQPGSSMMIAAEARGLDYTEVLELVIRSAARRYGFA